MFCLDRNSLGHYKFVFLRMIACIQRIQNGYSCCGNPRIQIPLNFVPECQIDNKWRQATSHYLNQWWPSSKMHISVTRRQWVKIIHAPSINGDWYFNQNRIVYYFSSYTNLSDKSSSNPGARFNAINHSYNCTCSHSTSRRITINIAICQLCLLLPRTTSVNSIQICRQMTVAPIWLQIISLVFIADLESSGDYKMS